MTDRLFTSYGRVMFSAQLVEQSIENLVWAELKRSGEASRDMRNRLEGESLGAVFRRVEPVWSQEHPYWTQDIRNFIRYRNYMAHTFFIDCAGFQTHEDILQNALIYLDEFETACSLAAWRLDMLTRALELPGGGRFSSDVEARLARQKGLTEDMHIKFKRFKRNA